MQYFNAPNYVKKKKPHKSRIVGHNRKAHLLEIQRGIAGLKVLENGRLTPKQLEATRRVLSKKMQRTGRIIFHVSPQTAITKKPREIRMGKGKGAIKLWVAEIKAGCILVEITNVAANIAKEILTSAAAKLPVKTIVVFSETETESKSELNELSL